MIVAIAACAHESSDAAFYSLSRLGKPAVGGGALLPRAAGARSPARDAAVRCIMVAVVAMVLLTLCSPIVAASKRDQEVLKLRLAPKQAAAFPPGRRYTPGGFWQAGPELALARGPQRPAADLVATGEAEMLGWFPAPLARTVTPLIDSHSLVRLLGGGSCALGSPGKIDGDVVLRDSRTGALTTEWELLWSRLDPWVGAAALVHPILVLDNVPWAFCDPTKCTSAGSNTPGAKYGMDFGPANCTEYAEWIESLLTAISNRYGEQRASQFWFRVGTEPNTRPGHWNDTNRKYVDEYIAVSAAVNKVLPKAKVGLANMGADGSASGWYGDVIPIARDIAKANAKVDFIAMSCYGRGTGNRCEQSPGIGCL